MLSKALPFQGTGIDFLTSSPRLILGDDMGLGKTFQALGACTKLGLSNVLIVTPTNLLWNWEKEIKMWLPQASIQIIWGETAQLRTARLKNLGKYQFSLIGYEMFRAHSADILALRSVGDAIIFDEAHRMRDRAIALTKKAFSITCKVPRIFFLTGTPILNHFYDIWPLLKMCNRKEFGSFWTFVERYGRVIQGAYGFEIEEIERDTHPKMIALRKAKEPYFLQRKKFEVLHELPPKRVQQIPILPLPAQKKIYNAFQKEMMAILSSGEVIDITMVLTLLLRLRQTLIDPSIISETQPETPLEGAKIDMLKTIVEGLGPNEKIVVFSNFARAIHRLKYNFQAWGLDTITISGDTAGPSRQADVDRFQTDPNIRGALVSIMAGGTGVTLTAASYGVFLDKHWTPGINEQAQDRLHRIGQKNSVNILELIVPNSADERVEECLRTKMARRQAVLPKEISSMCGRL